MVRVFFTTLPAFDVNFGDALVLIACLGYAAYSIAQNPVKRMVGEVADAVTSLLKNEDAAAIVIHSALLVKAIL